MDIQINYSRNGKAVKIQAGNTVITNNTEVLIMVSVKVSIMAIIMAPN